MIRWTPEMIEFVRQAVKDMTLRETAEQLSLAYGITVTLDQVKGVTSRHGIKTGRTGRFEPGHITWNAGMKGWKAGGRSEETRFKPGYLNGRAAERLKPLGHERITKDGIRQRKVRMDGPSQYRWQSVHSLVWEEHNGPIPPGHVVIFIDGDRENIHIDNLALVSRGELALLNKRGWNDLPAELRPAAIAAVRLEKQAKAREEAA